MNPTLTELRARVHKDRHREIGNVLARRVARPSAVYGTWLAVRLGLSANQVTLLALLAGLAGAACFGVGSRTGFVAGVVLCHVAFWLDHVDGQVARWRETASLSGVYFDYLMHHVSGMALGFGLGFGIARQGGELLWVVAGFGMASGWTVLSLHNDCRYKALFQRLKREHRSFRVVGGSAERPTPPQGWPRSGRGSVTWPLFKLCEPHVVLITLTVLGVVAFFSHAGWAVGLQVYVLGMALLAPTLAAARIARAINRRTTDADFERWFRPDHG